MPDWYRDHNISPEAAGEDAYLGWAQASGLRVDAAGNVTDPAEDPRPAGGIADPHHFEGYWDEDEDEFEGYWDEDEDEDGPF
jgi:hypothetical protein